MAECVTDVLTTFWLNSVRINCFISRKARESGAFPILTNTKKPFNAIYDLTKMKQSHWLLYGWQRIVIALG